MASKTVNVHPFHCDQETTGNGFILTFYGQYEGGRDIRVRLHFEFWWVRFIATQLWKAIAYRRKAVEEAEAAMEARQ